MTDNELDHEPDHRPMRYVECLADGYPTRVVYRASSLGGCDRAYVACATGQEARPHPAWFQEVLDEGTHAEVQINAWWEAATSIPTVLKQAELVLDTLIEVDLKFNGAVVSVPVVVKAHVDGFALPAASEVVVREFKKFRPSTYPNFQRQGCEVQKNYPWQIAAVMHAIHQQAGEYPLVELVGALWSVRPDEPEGTAPHVVDCTLHMVDNPPIPLRAIRQKISRIEGLIADGYVATDVAVECREDSYPCPYWYLHPSELAGGKANDKPATVKIKISDDHEINGWLAEEQTYTAQLKGLDDDKAKLDQARKQVRAKITGFLDERGIDTAGGSADVNGVIVERVERQVKEFVVQARVDRFIKVRATQPSTKEAAVGKPKRVRKSPTKKEDQT